jgi:lipopolysaccharide export LptBFGC system permease protein LptF
MKILDRHLIAIGLQRWLLVLFLGTFLIMLGDFIAQVGSYLSALFSARWWMFLAYEAVRLPTFIGTWLPLSTLVAAMLTAAPLINQGTLTALGAAGIAPARVFRVFMILGIVTGAASFLINDQVAPRLMPLADRLELAMSGKGDLRLDRDRAAGWRSGASLWSAANGRPAAAIFGNVAVFRADSSHRMLSAQRLIWEGDGWMLIDGVVVEGESQQAFAKARPAELGFELRFDRQALINVLRADDSRTSDELIATHAKRRYQILCYRIAVALLPLLCLLYGLPRFVRWIDRTRLPVVGAKSVLWALLPLLAVGLLARLLVSAGAQPVFLAVGIIGVTATIGYLRWHRMAL